MNTTTFSITSKKLTRSNGVIWEAIANYLVNIERNWKIYTTTIHNIHNRR